MRTQHHILPEACRKYVWRYTCKVGLKRRPYRISFNMLMFGPMHCSQRNAIIEFYFQKHTQPLRIDYWVDNWWYLCQSRIYAFDKSTYSVLYNTRNMRLMQTLLVSISKTNCTLKWSSTHSPWFREISSAIFDDTISPLNFDGIIEKQ